MSTDKAATDKKVPDANDKTAAASKPEEHKGLNDKLQADGNEKDKKATDDKKAEDDKKTADAKPAADADKKDDGSKKPEEHKGSEHKAEGEHKDGDHPKDLTDQLAEEYQDIMAALKKGEQSLLRKVSAWTGYGDAQTASVPKEFPQNLHLPRDHHGHGQDDQRREFTAEAKVNLDGKPRTADGKKLDADGKVVSEASATAVGGDGISKPGDPPKPGDPLAKPVDKAAETTPPAEHSYWNDFTSWTADTFDNVTKKFVDTASWAEENLCGLTDWVGDKWTDFENWMDGAGEQKAEQKAKEGLAKGDAAFNLDGAKDATGNKLEMPADAQSQGKTKFMGNDVEVFKSGNDTYLKNDKGEVIAKQNEKGEFEIVRPDKSLIKVKVSDQKDADGNLKLEKLERYDEQGRLTTKVVDGIVYNVTYKDGRAWVQATGDVPIDHALTPQEQHEYMQKILKNMPEGLRGSAIINFVDKNNPENNALVSGRQRRDGSFVEMNFKDNQIRYYEGGKEFRFDNGKLTIVGPDGKPHDLTADERKEYGDRIKKLMEELQKRGRDGHNEGFWHDRGADGRFTFGQFDDQSPEPAKPDITTTEVDTRPDKPPGAPTFKTTDHVKHETTVQSGNNFEVTNTDTGEKVLGFDEKKGAELGNDTLVNDQGLTDLISGTLITKDGDVIDASGKVISEGSIGSHSSSASAERMTFAQEVAEGQKGSAMVNAMIGPALALVWSGNAGVNIASALGVIYEAIGIGAHYLGSLGNNFLARAPVESAIGQAQSAGTKALWQYTTISVASKEGIPASSFAAAYATQRIIGTNASVADIVQEAKGRYGPNELT